jgi:SRSO17 transposase
LADLEAEPFNSANDGLWTRGLLIRRRIADGDLAFFTTWCPAGTSIETLVAVEGHRRTALKPRKTSSAPSQREQILARLPGDARLRHDGRDPASR